MKKILFVCLVFTMFAKNILAATEVPLNGIFAHGLGGFITDSLEYATIFGPLVSTKGSEWDRAVYGESAGPEQSCLAQQADIDVVVREMAKHVGRVSMFVGVSKGAATMFNTIGYCAEHSPELLDGLRVAIFECPFRNPGSVARIVVKKTAAYIRDRNRWMLENQHFSGSTVGATLYHVPSVFYKNYHPDGATPEKALAQWALPTVSRDMVVVFIHSQKDALISVNDSRYLYSELLKLGYRNAYLIELEHGDDAFELWGAEKEFVYSCLRAIYERHGFALSDLLRDAMPLEDLTMVQPTIEQVAERMAGGGRK